MSISMAIYDNNQNQNYTATSVIIGIKIIPVIMITLIFRKNSYGISHNKITKKIRDTDKKNLVSCFVIRRTNYGHNILKKYQKRVSFFFC